MPRKKGTNTGIPGQSFSWKRTTGVTKLKQSIARQTGIPTTKAGRQRKIGKMATSGCAGTILFIAALIAIATLILITAFAATTSGQSKRQQRPPAHKPTTKALSDDEIDKLPFAAPIEVRTGYHRMKDPAVFVTLRNDGSNLTIKSIGVIVLTIDSIKMKPTHVYDLVFSFAIPITPKNTGEAVVTNKDDYSIGSDIDLARCKDFEPSKDDPTLFIPNSCISGQDLISFRITSIKYTDGTVWKPPSKNK